MVPPRSSLWGLLASLVLFFATLASADIYTNDEPKLKSRADGDKYLIGVGKADITGPVVEIGFAGYADLAQKGTGLRQRLYSRAFIVGDVNKPDDRFVYLVLDIQAGDTAMRYGILEALEELGEDYAMFGSHNVAVTGTHSHAGPGAWFNYLLPQVTSFGFDKQSYQAIVDGAALSIKRAQESLEEVSAKGNFWEFADATSRAILMSQPPMFKTVPSTAHYSPIRTTRKRSVTDTTTVLTPR